MINEAYFFVAPWCQIPKYGPDYTYDIYLYIIGKYKSPYSVGSHNMNFISAQENEIFFCLNIGLALVTDNQIVIMIEYN